MLSLPEVYSFLLLSSFLLHKYTFFLLYIKYINIHSLIDWHLSCVQVLTMENMENCEVCYKKQVLAYLSLLHPCLQSASSVSFLVLLSQSCFPPSVTTPALQAGPKLSLYWSAVPPRDPLWCPAPP